MTVDARTGHAVTLQGQMKHRKKWTTVNTAQLMGRRMMRTPVSWCGYGQTTRLPAGRARGARLGIRFPRVASHPTWTATADSILAKVDRLAKAINGTSH